MRCRKVRSFLSAYCNDELTGRKKLAISEHLSTCSSCRREEAAIQSISLATRQVSELKVSDDFNTRLLNRIAQERFKETRTRAFFPKRAPVFTWGRVAPVFVSACLLIVVGIFSFKQSESYLTVQPVNNPNMTVNMKKDWSLNDQLARAERVNRITNRMTAAAGYLSAFDYGNRMVSSSHGNIRPLPYIESYYKLRPVVRIYRSMLTIFFRGARKIILFSIIWAVFFIQPVRAFDSSLYNLEVGLNDLIYQLTRSVVTVESTRSIKIGFLNPGDEAVHNIISSGIIFDSVGHVVVEASSVADCDRIAVRFENLLLPARLVGIDYQTGLALLATDSMIGSPVGYNDQYACAGKLIIAIGNSYGLQSCPTIGFCAGSRPDGTIQFSGSIASGTLGGGLFDLGGNLVGIISGGIGESNQTRAALAVPIYKVIPAVDYMIAHGNRDAGYVGITTTDIEIFPGIGIDRPYRFAGENVKDSRVIEKALLVSNIVPFSPADKAGLRINDLIYGIDKRRLYSALELMKMVQNSKPGMIVELAVIRNSNPLNLKLRIGRRDIAPLKLHTNSNETFPDILSLNDSLLKEINYLKKNIDRLENQFRTVNGKF